MKPEEIIRAQFGKASIVVCNISKGNENLQGFGDFVFYVESNIGKFRVLSDRGQIFIDIFDSSSGAYIRGDKACPALLSVYNKGMWELWELLDKFKSQLP